MKRISKAFGKLMLVTSTCCCEFRKEISKVVKIRSSRSMFHKGMLLFPYEVTELCGQPVIDRFCKEKNSEIER